MASSSTSTPSRGQPHHQFIKLSAASQPGGRLYGRKREETQLLEAYQAVRSEQRNQLVLISGEPGTGKTALANTLRSVVVQKDKGFFVSGKFEQMLSLEPYEAFVSALTEYTDQLLDYSASMDPTLVETVKEDILQAIGPESGILTGVIPALERLWGQPPETSSRVYGSAALYRFRYVFCCMVRALTQQRAPLVMLLDDVQWADIASIELVRSLLVTSNMSLLLICTQRSTTSSNNSLHLGQPQAMPPETGPESSPLNTLSSFEAMLRDFEQEKIDCFGITNIRLDDLDREHVEGMLSDLLEKSPDETEELVEVVCKQSHGNIFHILQFLRLLLDEGFLSRDDDGRWRWNSDQIRQQLTSEETIMDLIRRKIESLPRLLQECLKVASCMGDEIDDSALDLVLTTNVGRMLEHGVDEGLLVFQPHLGGYWFAHDLIRQTAFEMIPEDERAEFYLKIGRRLWQSSSAVARDKNIFVIVTLLNKGVMLMKEERERYKAAALNLKAGEHAIKVSAFPIASFYLRSGIKLLGSNRWNDEYELSLALYCRAADVEVTNGNFETVVALSDEVLKHARSLPDKLAVYAAWMRSMSQQDNLNDVITVGLDVLRQLGEPLPANASKFSLRLEFLKVRMALWGKSNEALLNLPPMEDESKIAAMTFLNILFVCSYQMRSRYTALIALRAMRLTMKYGIHPGSAVAFGFYGSILCGLGIDVVAGRRFGQLGVSMAERMRAREVFCKTHFLSACAIRHWTEPVLDTLPDVQFAGKLGAEVGDVIYSMLAETMYWAITYFLGTQSLLVVEAHFLENIKRARLIQSLSMETWNKIHLQHVQCLNGRSINPARLSGTAIEFDETLKLCEETKNLSWVATLYFNAMDLAYLFGDYAFAGEMAEKVREQSRFPSTFYTRTENRFMDGLVTVALARQGTDRRSNLKLAAVALKEIAKWAKSSPQTHLCKQRLLEAELMSFEEKKDASRLYEDAIELATTNMYTRYAALACERMGDYKYARGAQELAAVYWKRAITLYDEWNAVAKSNQLQNRLEHACPFLKT